MIDNLLEETIENKIAKIKEVIMTMKLKQCVIGVDPAFGGESNTGIIIAAKSQEKIVVLEDLSGNYKSVTWIYIVQKLSLMLEATISIEVNHGSELIISLFRGFAIVPQRAVSSKYERAIFCYLLYRQKKVFHLYPLVELEREMLYFEKEKKDRVDALFWSIYYLEKNYQYDCELLRSF